MDIGFAERIQTDPRVLLGKPVVKGTRISVGFLLNALATMTMDEILEAYPFLTREDIAAALRYAAAVVDAPGVGKAVSAHEVPAQ